MAASNNKSGGKPSGSRARSVGAAGSMHPNGAILNSDDSAEWLARRKNFDDWKDKRKKKALTMDKVVRSMYANSPSHNGMDK